MEEALSSFAFVPNLPTVDGVFEPALMDNVVLNVELDGSDLWPLPIQEGKAIACLPHGCIAILHRLAFEVGIKVDHLHKYVTDALYRQRLFAKMINFYSAEQPDNKVTESDCVNMIRLHILGGGMKKWLEGMDTGTFYTQDGQLIGTTTPKNVSTICREKQQNKLGYEVWPRPYEFGVLCTDIRKVAATIISLNADFGEKLCTPEMDRYARECRVISGIIGACQCHVASRIADVVGNLSGFHIDRMSPGQVLFDLGGRKKLPSFYQGIAVIGHRPPLQEVAPINTNPWSFAPKK